MEEIIPGPYVVSQDIRILVERWAEQRGFLLPAPEFFGQLRADFSSYMRRAFPRFEFVQEEEISSGLKNLIAKSGLPAVSLDEVYCTSELGLQIGRLVDGDGNNYGLGRRSQAPRIARQLDKLKASGIKEAVVVDDVVYTGSFLGRIIKLLSKTGIQVPLVCAGIGISEGFSRIAAEVRCVRTYEKVIDEVCERDFYPGVPLSGRLLAGSDNVGVPYLLPFGRPESWASIPRVRSAAFSRFCLRQTIELFEEIERCSSRPVPCRDLGRYVAGLPKDGTRYVEVLRNIA